MYLIIAATEMELAPVRAGLDPAMTGVEFLVSGIGPVETALNLTRHLAGHSGQYQAVINCGAAGAYLDSGPAPLDICLASAEVLAEVGICQNNGIVDLNGPDLRIRHEFDLDTPLLARAESLLAGLGIACKKGRFITVACVSGSEQRGNYLRDRFGAICENMEGAAVARVCEEFGLECLELRWISNLVEDRDRSRWQLAGAGAMGGRVTAELVTALLAGS
ncbi:MAG: futalosine hydrolase [Desulfobacterales bacterium]|nr:futalosine hydrolase [Desulfobacterales bacterium]